MNVQRQIGRPAARFHEERTHRQIGDEMSVHDVDVDPIGACLLNGVNCVAEFQEVCSEDRRRENVCIGHRSNHTVRAEN